MDNIQKVLVFFISVQKYLIVLDPRDFLFDNLTLTNMNVKQNLVKISMLVESTFHICRQYT